MLTSVFLRSFAPASCWLNPWERRRSECFDEFHAGLVGSAKVEKQSDALERSMKSGLYIHSLAGLPGNEIKAQEDSGQRPSALENGYLDRKTRS